MESNNQLTMLDVEKSLSSNLCRCTGYRPILDSFKKFAVDSPAEDKIKNIKDLSICKKSNNCCRSFAKDNDWCMVEDESARKMLTMKMKDGKTWYRPTLLDELLKLLKQNLESYILIGGNTAKGNYNIIKMFLTYL